MNLRWIEAVGVIAGLTLFVTPLADYLRGDQRPKPPVEPPAEQLEAAPATLDQSPSAVIGRVVDALGHPVKGVAVFVRPLARTVAPLVKVFFSDSNGRFQVTGLPPGHYSFVAIHGGHPPGSMPAVPVAPELGVEVEIVLDHHNLIDA